MEPQQPFPLQTRKSDAPPPLSQIEMAQKLLNSDLAELISKMKLAQQYVMTRWEVGPERLSYSPVELM